MPACFAAGAACFAAGAACFAAGAACFAAGAACFACCCAGALPCTFGAATGFFTTGFAAGFFPAAFFVATGFLAAGFFATGLCFFAAGFGAGFLRVGFFALAAGLDFADDLRTGFLAMGILTVTASSPRGRTGTAGRRPCEVRAARENFKFYHVDDPGDIGRPAAVGGLPPDGGNRAGNRRFGSDIRAKRTFLVRFTPSASPAPATRGDFDDSRHSGAPDRVTGDGNTGPMPERTADCATWRRLPCRLMLPAPSARGDPRPGGGRSARAARP
ncbi:MAG: hypothetical protein IPF73_12135 [Betaproteobacteria bacterium]|nr:hypothetical protein [Betaproteobacteria bacterium]